MAKRGPKGPSKPMTDKEFQQIIGMMKISCTRDEICSILDISMATLDRRLKERGFQNFEVLYKKYCGEGKMSLRRQQWKSAQEGNVSMQIWLGKQWLGQRDKVENDHTSSDGSMTPQRIEIVGVKAKDSEDLSS